MLREMAPKVNQRADLYSFGIIAHEIVVRRGVFFLGLESLSAKEIVEGVKEGRNPPLRPSMLDATCQPEVTRTIAKCWSEDSNGRPSFKALDAIFKKINRKCNTLHNFLPRMEQYTVILEDILEKRTADFLAEKQKSEDVLYQMIPKTVAKRLMNGKVMAAEKFDNATVYFSDIADFAVLVEESTPSQIVTLLDEFYACVDSIIDPFDAYKVDTTGDCYMIVSGAPDRNGIGHAAVIGRMALALLEVLLRFEIPHRPYERLKLRIGIHSGPCTAGVVGHHMPKYCLLGETVNIASRMRSTGEPLKIHVSSKTKELLDVFGSFKLENRDDMQIKAKTMMTTYWLKEEHSMEQNDRFTKETKI